MRKITKIKPVVIENRYTPITDKHPPDPSEFIRFTINGKLQKPNC